jgi:hypothetical protein
MTKTRLVTVGLVVSLWGCGGGTAKSPGQSDGPDAQPVADGGGGAEAPASPSDARDAPASSSDGRDAPASSDARPLDGGGTAPDQAVPPQVVGACDALAPVGTWQEITPPAVTAGLANKMPGDGSGTFAFAVDPVNSGTLYVGTVYQKMWKSTDCGSTWAPLGTGRHASSWDHAMNWTFAVDPVEANVVYTNSGYGTQGAGLLKSTNAGVDWDIIWPPAQQPDLAAHFQYNFANVLTIDPADHHHLVLTFHEACIGVPGVATCIAESFDAGATWKLLPGDPAWVGNEGQLFYFLDDSHTWIWASQSNGFYRSENSGASWTVLLNDKGKPFFPSHLQGAGLYRAKNGVFYVAAGDGILRSPDGKTWTVTANTGPIGGGLASDGTTIFASRCFFDGFCAAGTKVFLSSPETDGVTWTLLPNGPPLAMGGEMHYDSGHHLLFASTFKKGFWRVVTK